MVKLVSTKSRFALVASLALVMAASCGRSEPFGAGTQTNVSTAGAGAANADTESEDTGPSIAGVRVTSDSPVVIAGPTSIPPSTSTTLTASGSTYVVKPGDTLSVIAEQFEVGVDAISQANGITDVHSIKPGQELVIPPKS